MITTLMNQKRGLNILSQLPDDGDPLAPNNLLKPGAKEVLQFIQEVVLMNFFFKVKII